MTASSDKQRASGMLRPAIALGLDHLFYSITVHGRRYLKVTQTKFLAAHLIEWNTITMAQDTPYSNKLTFSNASIVTPIV